MRYVSDGVKNRALLSLRVPNDSKELSVKDFLI